MKIIAAALPVSRPLVASKPPGTRFAALIAAPMDGDAALSEEPSATAFSARGMFGLYGAVTTPALATAPTAAPTASPAPPSSPTATQGPQSMARGPENGSMQGARTASPTAPTGFGKIGVEATARPSSSGAVSSVGDPLSATSRADDVEGAAPVRSAAARKRATPSPVRPTETLVLGPTDPSRAAGLTIRATNLNPDEAARFRARAQAVLRDHGIALDKIRLNGEDHSAVDPQGRST